MSQLLADPNVPSDESVQSRESQLLKTLQQYWGYDSFRPQQLDAINAVMDNRDSIVIFPTGGGKSLCFQVPAIERDGVAVPSRRASSQRRRGSLFEQHAFVRSRAEGT